MTTEKRFLIDWDKGEKYYQIHVFETPEHSIWLLSSKINPEGKIVAILRHVGFQKVLSYDKPITPEEFNQLIQPIIESFKRAGGVHRFVDLSDCQTLTEQLGLLQKMEPGFKYKVWSKGDYLLIKNNSTI